MFIVQKSQLNSSPFKVEEKMVDSESRIGC